VPFAVVGAKSFLSLKPLPGLARRLPTFAALFDANGKLDYEKLSHPEYLAIRQHSPALVHLGPIGKRW